MIYGLNIIISDRTRHIALFSDEEDREEYIKMIKGIPMYQYAKFSKPNAKAYMVSNKGKSIKDLYEKIEVKSLKTA